MFHYPEFTTISRIFKHKEDIFLVGILNTNVGVSIRKV